MGLYKIKQEENLDRGENPKIKSQGMRGWEKENKLAKKTEIKNETGTGEYSLREML